MENQPLQSKVITITAYQDGGTRIGLKDERGLSYSFFKTIQSGAESVAWKDYKKMNIQVGTKIGINYQESKQVSGGKNITYRNIRQFVDANDVTMKANEPVYEGVTRDYDKEAYGKCLFGFLIEAYKMGKALNQTVLDDCHVWAKASMTGKLVLPKWTSEKPASLNNEPQTEDLGINEDEIF